MKGVFIAASVLMVGILMGVALMVYMATRTAEVAQEKKGQIVRQASAINALRQMGMAVKSFTAMEGRYPKSLAELSGYLSDNPAFYWSEADPREKPAEMPMDEVDTWSSYRINPEIAGKRTTEVGDPTRTVLVFERPEIRNDGSYAVFADGHVDFVPSGE